MSWRLEFFRMMLRRAGPALILFAGMFVLSGCAFKPLYGVNPSGVSVSDELAYVSIPKRKDRVGQLIRNRLLSTMSPAGGPVGDRYILELRPESNTNQLLIQPDGDIVRRLYELSVEYRLIDTNRKKILHEGKTFSHVAYDRVRSEFANIQAETDATERASIQVADDIRTRLANYFASR